MLKIDKIEPNFGEKRQNLNVDKIDKKNILYPLTVKLIREERVHESTIYDII